MSQFPKYFKEQLNGQPVEVCSLQLFPLKMGDYMVWTSCKPVLTLRLGTLPAAYAVLPYASALYAMDMDGPKNAWTAKFLTLICKAANIPLDTAHVRVTADPQNPKKLQAFQFLQAAKWVTLTPTDCAKVRQAIAQQNGETIPDEADNPELLEAAEFLRSKGVPALDWDVFSMMDAVACCSHIRIAQLLDWTIWEFETRAKSIQRIMGYQLSYLAESQGNKFKSGNPYPSWCFDRASSYADVFVPENAILSKLGQVGHIKQKG